MKSALLLFAAMALSAQTETVSNGIKIRTEPHTEGISIFVTPSSCRIEAIRVVLRTAKPQGFDTKVATKPVFNCDQRAVEFRFLLPGPVLLIQTFEMSTVNTGAV